MAYRHGVYTSEIPTSLVPPAQSEAGLPVFIGTAPVHLTDPTNVNKPVLCYTYAEAVQQFGMSNDWDKYTLCEAIYSQFTLYNVAPVVLINVLDPAKHKTAVTPTEKTLTNGTVDLGTGVIIDSVVATTTVDETTTTFVADTDYSVSYDDNHHAIFTAIADGALGSATKVTIGYDTITPDSVTDDDIVGGIDAQTGEATGCELIDSVFPKFKIVPGLLAAPKFSSHSLVAAVLRAKAESINGGFFSGISVVDAPCDGEQANYTHVPEWKGKKNFTSEFQIVCWPKVKLGDKTFHLSTQLIGLMNKTDANNGDIPFVSPSNKLLQMDSCVDETGNEINLGPDQANYLNGQGVVTALNWIGGWRAWGNRTALYPAGTDVKDAFLCERRMFSFLRNTFVTTFWQKVDAPITLRLVRTIVDSFNYYLNGLVSQGALLGGRIEFQEAENVITDLMDGILKFHIYITPPPPARVIEGKFEFDPMYFSELFA